MTGTQKRVGAVVLTYNSSQDLPACLAGLWAQRGVDLRVIVVDNASKRDERALMQATFREFMSDGRIMAVEAAAAPDTSAAFLCNDVNAGYSAGNNIGARFADGIGCEAVLIVNPDVRIDDQDYVSSLVDLITKDTKTAVACSAVTNLSGDQENPMSEPGFIQELLWPVKMVLGGVLQKKVLLDSQPETPVRVDKVSGSCFMIRLDFLRRIGFFDETVFLYCEESILSAQVREAGWHMIMDPRRGVLHAHRTNAKGDPLPRFRNWAKSRRRYHVTYGGYGPIGRALLVGSRSVTLALVWIKFSFKQIVSRMRQISESA
jgi:GT2 family glycosyltransferase